MRGVWAAVLVVEMWLLGPAIAVGLLMGLPRMVQEPGLLLTPVALALLLLLRMANGVLREMDELQRLADRIREE